ncbi:MAG: hypothetical protein RBS39_01780 [Phycisphaerales bacterium]|jgi:hypothetical protein|nr:hypothetical protein [Phycisphaerales bacterium]
MKSRWLEKHGPLTTFERSWRLGVCVAYLAVTALVLAALLKSADSIVLRMSVAVHDLGGSYAVLGNGNEPTVLADGSFARRLFIRSWDENFSIGFYSNWWDRINLWPLWDVTLVELRSTHAVMYPDTSATATVWNSDAPSRWPHLRMERESAAQFYKLIGHRDIARAIRAGTQSRLVVHPLPSFVLLLVLGLILYRYAWLAYWRLIASSESKAARALREEAVAGEPTTINAESDRPA